MQAFDKEQLIQIQELQMKKIDKLLNSSKEYNNQIVYKSKEFLNNLQQNFEKIEQKLEKQNQAFQSQHNQFQESLQQQQNYTKEQEDKLFGFKEQQQINSAIKKSLISSKDNFKHSLSIAESRIEHKQNQFFDQQNKEIKYNIQQKQYQLENIDKQIQDQKNLQVMHEDFLGVKVQINSDRSILIVIEFDQDNQVIINLDQLWELIDISEQIDIQQELDFLKATQQIMYFIMSVRNKILDKRMADHQNQ